MINRTEQAILRHQQTQVSKPTSLVTTGIGYLSGVEWKKSHDGNSFLTCTVAAIHGNQQYIYTQCVVCGDEAIGHIDQCLEASNAENKILIRFSLGLTGVNAYLKNDGTGTPAACLKGNLFKVTYVKIENQVVFQASQEANEHQDNGYQPDDNYQDNSGYQDNNARQHPVPNAAPAQGQGRPAQNQQGAKQYRGDGYQTKGNPNNHGATYKGNSGYKGKGNQGNNAARPQRQAY